MIVRESFYSDKTDASAEDLVFFLYHAGGAAHVYLPWLKNIPASIQAYVVELPGHGFRVSQPCATNLSEVLPSLISDIMNVAKGKRFIIYGHSLGALIAYELTRNLLAHGEQFCPCALFISGLGAPQIVASRNADKPSPTKFDDEKLVHVLHRFSRTPPGILENSNLRKYFLDVFRADWQILHNYKYFSGTKLPMPIQVFGGDADVSTSYEDLKGWESEGESNVSITMLPGDHFFPNANRERILQPMSDIFEIERAKNSQRKLVSA